MFAVARETLLGCSLVATLKRLSFHSRKPTENSSCCLGVTQASLSHNNARNVANALENIFSIFQAEAGEKGHTP